MKAIVIIRLEIETESTADAVDVVDTLLDTGLLQEEINEHHFDACDLHVTSATCSLDEASP